MPRKATPLSIRNRVTELRYVRPQDLADHPAQWRIHGDLQRQAMDGLLKEIGIAGALLAYESPTTGLTSIDGHLRKSLADVLWPTLILDLTDEEARLLLASYDPISAMAETNRTMLDTLLREVSSGEASVQAFLTQLAEEQGIVPPNVEFPAYDESVADDVQYHECPECGHRWPQ